MIATTQWYIYVALLGTAADWPDICDRDANRPLHLIRKHISIHTYIFISLIAKDYRGDTLPFNSIRQVMRQRLSRFDEIIGMCPAAERALRRRPVLFIFNIVPSYSFWLCQYSFRLPFILLFIYSFPYIYIIWFWTTPWFSKPTFLSYLFAFQCLSVSFFFFWLRLWKTLKAKSKKKKVTLSVQEVRKWMKSSTRFFSGLRKLKILIVRARWSWSVSLDF